MGFSYNRTTLLGRLTRDPEIKIISDSHRTTFVIAVDRSYRKDDGSRDTDFINIVCWGRLGELASKYLHKGDPVLVEGKLYIRNYEKNSEKRKYTEINADNFQVLAFPGESKKDATSIEEAEKDLVKEPGKDKEKENTRKLAKETA
ncbi:MAG: single-stranded DNA-binding protein [Candidatus Margulisbacteria bacterium]|nr:single-stranded DNA-binding protein [Candidatus Margulisiibacteriota bacterium]